LQEGHQYVSARQRRNAGKVRRERKEDMKGKVRQLRLLAEIASAGFSFNTEKEKLRNWKGGERSTRRKEIRMTRTYGSGQNNYTKKKKSLYCSMKRTFESKLIIKRRAKMKSKGTQ